MSEVIVRMEMPKVCYHGNCPIDRIWCIERNAPSEMTMKDAYAEMKKRIPSWCPIIGVLPEQHGRLVDERELFARCRPVKNFDNPDALVIVKGAVIQSQTIVPATEGSETNGNAD